MQDAQKVQDLKKIDLREKAVHDIAVLEKRIFSDAWSERGIRETLEQNNVIVLGTWDEYCMIGYVILYYVLDEGEIARIAVDAEYRRQGAAGRLMQCLQKKCEEKGIKRIMLDVRIGNNPAITFYQAQGFEKDGIRRGYYANPTEDALLMSQIIV